MAAGRLETDKEVFEAIASKISSITGVQLGEKQSSLVISRLTKHLRNLGGISPLQYWDYLNANEAEEIPVLISLLTTHHTFFFREQVHFEQLEKELPRLIKAVKAEGRQTLRIWCAACSHGQEGYTIAMFLDYHLKQLGAHLDYKILFSDIDQESVKIASNGIYRTEELSRVPITYRSNHWLRGSGDVADYSKVKTQLQEHCEFKIVNLLELSKEPVKEPFDIIFCRNVFIYFTSQEIERISNQLIRRMAPHGLLFIGVSESLTGLNIKLEHVGKSIYRKPESGGDDKKSSEVSAASSATPLQNWIKQHGERPRSSLDSPANESRQVRSSGEALRPHTEATRVQSEVSKTGIDAHITRSPSSRDTAPVLRSGPDLGKATHQEHPPGREILAKRVITLQKTLQIGIHVRQLINTLPDFRSVGFEVVASSTEAINKIMEKRAEILIIDSSAARFLQEILNKLHLPALIIHSPGQTAQDLEHFQGLPHVLIVEKDFKHEHPGQKEDIQRVLQQLGKIEQKQIHSTLASRQPLIDTQAVIAIGASTGGTEALSRIIMELPEVMPPILIVQHIPEGFSRAFAERLHQISRLQVKEAVDGDALEPARVLVAPGNKQMEIVGRPGHYKVHIHDGDKVNGHRPSVDVLFQSMARNCKSRMIGIILTGMGSDGATGLLAMKEQGALTFGQDAASSVVYGMPKVAFQMGGVTKVLPLQQIAAELIRVLTLKDKTASAS